jgi:hypothetical protein
VTTPTGSPYDLSSYCEDTQWSVQQEYGRQGSTATFVLTAPTGYSDPSATDTYLTTRVKPFSTVVFTDTGTGAVIFAGIAQQPYLVFLSATVIQYWVQCVDYTFYADNALVNASYPPMAGDQIIRQLCSDANNGNGCGITPGVVTSAPPVTAFQSNYLQLTDAWDQVGSLVSWQNDYNWQVDSELHVNWETSQAIASPALQNSVGYVTFSDSPETEGAMTTTLGYIDVSQMFQYIWDGSSLRNECVVQGANITKTTTQTWQGDGVTGSFTLTYDLDGSVDATLTVGGIEQSVSVVTDVATTTSDYCLVQSTIDGLWSLVNGVSGPPGAGQVISLSYTYNVPITQVYKDTTSQAQYDGPNGGVYAVYLSDNTLTTNAMALARAQSEVAQYAYVLETFTFTTAWGWPGHVDVGDAIWVSVRYIPDALNNWDIGIDDVYIVIRNNIQGGQVGYRQYQVTAVRYHTLNNL